MTADDCAMRMLPDRIEFSNIDQYLDLRARDAPVLGARWLWGEHLAAACGEDDAYIGFCSLCQQPQRFDLPLREDGRVNLREGLHCSGCALNARVRMVVKLLAEDLPPDRDSSIYLTEQTTRLYRHVRQRWPRVTGSEYFDRGDQVRLQLRLVQTLGKLERLRFEDVTDLSFKDDCFDAIVSCDVLEHVPDYRAALREMARVLKPEGRLILTVPLMDQAHETVVRARIDAQGQVEHLLEPEYHGDPVSADGVLAFYNFGWDLLNEVREAGFSSARWVLPWAPAEGIFFGLWTLLARR